MQLTTSSNRATNVTFRFAALAALCLVAAASGCTSEDKKSSDGGASKGDPCLSPGLTANDCMCAGGGNGLRTCGQDGIWGACECAAPVPEGMCRAGQQLLCTCPDDSQKVIRCMPDGTYDCGCGGDGGATAQPSDASTTSDAATAAQDAASGGDAGN